MVFGRSWGILEHAGRVQEVPRGRQRDSRSRPKASKRSPRSAQERLRDPKGRGRSAPDSLGLALLGRRRATGLVSGAFAEIDVLRCKFNGFGGFGPPRIVAGGTGQRRWGQLWGLASSLWGLWLAGSGSWGALGHWAGRPLSVSEQNGSKDLLRSLVSPRPPADLFV